MFGHLTYLTFELVWALPVLTVHWLVGRRVLAPRLRFIVLAAGLPTAYLSVADGIALRCGIWTLHTDRLIGLRLGDVPLEEIVFFLISNLMVVQSVLLFQALGLGDRATRRARGGAPIAALREHIDVHLASDQRAGDSCDRR